ncbi:hypothetical protein FJQ98_16350 [Lysinibacillus agricola]|uniref:DUF5348 domain-containing protein n=1 Tax=Lysinibacillus agricola TaxID=2590012 RepID=A0ABX7ALM8_9BACI|nr:MULTISPECIES: hypothetical protein [Lysinibacillus]KOS61496.1 hypothetical protein AN161_18065 [Lysinibacillus sp. FJAT-14222]QQP10816.1 hypothetical protein FJQ98_16350 [Lysinibacillus agricola]
MNHIVINKLEHVLTGSCGVIGTYSGYKDYHVGDIVEIKSSISGISLNVICEREGSYFPYGWRSASLKRLEEKQEMKKIYSYTHLNKKLINKCRHKLFIV